MINTNTSSQPVKKAVQWPKYREVKFLNRSLFLTVPSWVETLAINSDGSLWGYESLINDLECNRFRHWSPKMDTMSIKLDVGYDIIRWERSPIPRSHYKCQLQTI